MNNEAFLLLFLFFMVLMTLFPLVLRKWKIPGVIALLLAGMLIGPNGADLMGIIARHLSFLGGDPVKVEADALFLVKSLGSLGLVFLMSLAGMEADFKLIKSTKTPVIMLSVATFLIPAVTGYLVYWYFNRGDLPGKLLYASLFASHSVGIVFPVIRELKLTKTRFGAAVLISTIITDISSIVLLAMSVQLKKMESGVSGGVSRGISLFDHIDPAALGHWFAFVFILIVMLYLAAAYFIVSRAGQFLMRQLGTEPDVMVTIFLAVIMVSVIGGELLGVNLVVGAFIAGLGLSRVVKSETGAGGELFHKFEGIGYGLLVPFLFLSIGMETDLTILFKSVNSWQIILLTVAGLVLSKVFSGMLALMLSGFSFAKGICAGLMTVPQLSATLAAAAIGKDLGMLSAEFFNAIIVLSIVTTLPVPTLVRLLIERCHLKFENIADDSVEPYALPKGLDDEELL